MKNLFFVLVLVGPFFTSQLFSQSSIKFSQTFHSSNMNSVSVEIANPSVEIKSTKGSVIVVEIFVRISSSNYNLLEFMTRDGRYNILSLIDKMSRNMTLVDKELTKEITIDGEKIDEEIRYVIYLPERIKIIKRQIEKQLI